MRSCFCTVTSALQVVSITNRRTWISPVGCSGCCCSAVLVRGVNFRLAVCFRVCFSLCQFGITVWTFITVFISSWFFTESQIFRFSLFFLFFGGGFTSVCLSPSYHTFSFFVCLFFGFLIHWNWSEVISVEHNPHLLFFFLFPPPCLIFSCAPESQPSLRETGDLRAQGEATCPPPPTPLLMCRSGPPF